MAIQARFRINFLGVGVPWLQGFWGNRLRYSLLLMLDAFEQYAQTSTTARFPLIGDELPDGALVQIGKDRVMPRGPQESTTSYGVRLSKAFDAWRRAGSAEGQLRQVQAFFLPESTPVRMVCQDFTGNTASWYTILSYEDPNCPVEFTSPSNWDWDGDPARWARTWLVIYPQSPVGGAGPDWTTQATWGSGEFWDASNAWGIEGATPEECQAVRAIVARWKSAHTICQVVVAFDTGAPVQWPKPDGTGVDYPNGTWDDPANRYPYAAYFAPVA
jgi:hypothetical protein